MEAAIRWSPHSNEQNPRFLIIDVARNRLQLCQLQDVQGQKCNYTQLAVRDKLPNFTAFDWSKTSEDFLAVGSASGEALLLSIAQDGPQADFITSFPIKHQRKCNSIAFSGRDWLATGLDRVRNDFCMNVYDLNQAAYSNQQEPLRKLASSEIINSIKFFNQRPDLLVAGVSRQGVRIYDLRDSSPVTVGQFSTRHVHNLAIDPLDENYLISAGPSGDPAISLWDQRFIARSSPTTPGDGNNSGPVLEFRPAVNNKDSAATIWSLRFAGTKRGRFGILSSTGEVKVVETAQHFIQPPAMPTHYPVNPHGGAIWTSPYYTKMSHIMEYPWYDRHHGKAEDDRIIGFDFMRYDRPSIEQSAIAIRPNREVEVLKIPTKAPHIRFTPKGQYAFDGNKFIANEPEPKRKTIAEEMTRIENRFLHPDKRSSGTASYDDNVIPTFNALKIEDGTDSMKSPKTVDHEPEPPAKTFDGLLGAADIKLGIKDTLNILDTNRRRFLEGYRLDYKKNKEIICNEKDLVELWDTIQRIENLKKRKGMVANDMDLSYLGVVDIWNNHVDPTPDVRVLNNVEFSQSTMVNAIKGIVRLKEHPAFNGVSTNFPEHRQLCLAICGWTSSPQIVRAESDVLFSHREYYKAIALAVFKGHKTIALDLLKQATRSNVMSNIGLGAVIACDSVNPEQRDLCTWMAESVDDPYLRGLLQYFVSGDWSTVTSMPTISVSDRVGIALKHLPDATLTKFLNTQLAAATASGDVSAIALTGLSPRALDLFQSYIARTDDLPTAVLALSYTFPLYYTEDRFTMWRKTFNHILQAWRAYKERANYWAMHDRRAVRNGVCLNREPRAPMRLHCSHCHQPLARNDHSSRSRKSIADLAIPGKRRSEPPKRDPGASAGFSCLKCSRPMPRCSVCQLYLGTPDPRTPGGEKALQEESSSWVKQVVWCASCHHGCHGHHAREWFAKHVVCPVPDCDCPCGINDGPSVNG